MRLSGKALATSGAPGRVIQRPAQRINYGTNPAFIRRNRIIVLHKFNRIAYGNSIPAAVGQKLQVIIARSNNFAINHTQTAMNSAPLTNARSPLQARGT
ncbi:hypothetical protein NBRC116590_24340 [Pelagimonas sp. KU-00592-HH]